jgi:hypothetical protein
VCEKPRRVQPGSVVAGSLLKEKAEKGRQSNSRTQAFLATSGAYSDARGFFNIDIGGKLSMQLGYIYRALPIHDSQITQEIK